MNKSQLYKKVQDLFPSSLGEGDVVGYFEANQKQESEKEKVGTLLEYRDGGNDTQYIKLEERANEIFCHYVKLIRKRITISMLLCCMMPSNYYINSDGTFYKRIFNDNEGTMVNTGIRWLPREKGKDLHLYDQSIDMIKLVLEILK